MYTFGICTHTICTYTIGILYMYMCAYHMHVYHRHRMYAYQMYVYHRLFVCGSMSYARIPSAYNVCVPDVCVPSAFCLRIHRCMYTIGIECMRTRCICIPSAFCLRIHRCMYTIGMHLYKKGRRFVHVWRTTTALDDHSADKSARVMRVRGMRELGSMMFRMWMRVRL